MHNDTIRINWTLFSYGNFYIYWLKETHVHNNSWMTTVRVDSILWTKEAKEMVRMKEKKNSKVKVKGNKIGKEKKIIKLYDDDPKSRSINIYVCACALNLKDRMRQQIFMLECQILVLYDCPFVATPKPCPLFDFYFHSFLPIRSEDGEKPLSSATFYGSKQCAELCW